MADIGQEKWQDISAVWQAQLVAHCEPKSPRVLHKYIKNLLGFHVPREAPTPGTQAPFDFVAGAFFQEFERGLVLASRGGGKTRDVAILNLLASRFRPGTHTVHFGAVGRQGAWGHEYLRDMVRPRHQSDVVEKSERGIVLWRNGSWVRPATGHTDTGVTAIRANKGVWDEVDLWDMWLFEMSQMMVQGTQTNPVQRIFISTQYTAYGLMGQLLREADKRNMRVFRWDVFASMERCEKCYGQECPLFIWENPKTGQVEPLCKGRGLRADGFVPRRAVIDEFLATDPATWQVQKLLVEPEREHLILPTFDENKHTGAVPDEAFASETLKGCGVDWGFDHPEVFTVWAQVGDRYYGIHEHGERFMTPQRELEVARELNEQFGTVGHPLVFYCGADRPENIASLVEAGLVAAPCPIRSREARHRSVRRLLATDQALGGPRVMLDKARMPTTVWQLATVHKDEKTGVEVKENNDFFDSAEHFLAAAEFVGGIDAGGAFMA